MNSSISLLLIEVLFVGAALAFAVHELVALRRLKRKRDEKRDAEDSRSKP